MSIIALIPARGGSKGIVNKNLIPLAGKSMLGWTCEAALKTPGLDRIFLSTDCAHIANEGKSFGIEVPFLRPSLLARDETLMLPVIQHTLEWLDLNSINVKAIVLLQPTSPLRKSHHINEALKLYLENDVETVVSLVSLPHQFTPYSVQEISATGHLTPFIQNSDPPALRRQEKPQLFARNGPAILIVDPNLIRAGKLYGEKTIGYVMNKLDSLDIDDPEDLLFAEYLLSKNTHL